MGEAFTEEQGRLLPLPDDAFPADECTQVKIGKTPYARFDSNDYSVPHTHVQTTLTVQASPTRVRLLDGAAVVAEHPRTYDKGRQIEDAAHIEALAALKRAARKGRGKDRLLRAVPGAEALLVAAAERNHNIGVLTRNLLQLLERYGAEEVGHAVTEALARDVPHANAVRQSLERRRQERALPPPVAVPLEDERLRDLAVRPHDLGAYDNLEEAPDAG